MLTSARRLGDCRIKKQEAAAEGILSGVATRYSEDHMVATEWGGRGRTEAERRRQTEGGGEKEELEKGRGERGGGGQEKEELSGNSK